MNPADLPQRVLHSWPLEQWQHQTVVLAVSGGADSVAMLRLIHGLVGSSPQVIVAHFNHGWRGEESDRDQQFVQELAHSLGLTCIAEQASQPSSESRSEQTARRLRYAFLRKVAMQHQASVIATAHTASDRVETMLHNLCRGTGLSGVCSPTESRQLDSGLTLVRPLLNCYREQIAAYLQQLGQPYREDSSNRNEQYRRNFLRNSVLPMLRQVYGDGLDSRLLSFSQLVEQTVQLQQEQSQQYQNRIRDLLAQSILLGRLLEPSQNELVFPSQPMLDAAWPIVLLALQRQWHQRGWSQQAMSRKHWNRLREAWQRTTVPKQFKRTLRWKQLFQLPGSIEVASCNGWILLSKASPMQT